MDKKTIGLYALVFIMALICFLSGFRVGSMSMVEESVEICLNTCDCPEEHTDDKYNFPIQKIEGVKWIE